MVLENDYEVLGRLGEGAFGKVYKAKHRHSSEIVAVKQIKLGAKSWEQACRSTELQALKRLRHPFVVRLRELIRSQADGSLYYIFEYLDSDLCRLVRQNPQGLDESRAADLTRQLFAGLAYVHQYDFFHRDIKPENVLFDPQRETIRIADFGEARSLRARPPFTEYVGTRWYRAPECLLRDGNYSSPVDVWAGGLVFAELLRGSPVFCGTNSIDQLYKIIQVTGLPTDWPEFTKLSEVCRFRGPDGSPCGFQRVLPRASPAATGLASEILTLNPRRRPLAKKLLEHSFFGQLPPLDLGTLETSRSNAQGSGDVVDTARAFVRDSPREPDRTPQADGPTSFPSFSERGHPGLPLPPREAPDRGGYSSRGERLEDRGGQGYLPRLEGNTPKHPPLADESPRMTTGPSFEGVEDLDLDAELDKILGSADIPESKCARSHRPEAVPKIDINSISQANVSLSDLSWLGASYSAPKPDANKAAIIRDTPAPGALTMAFGELQAALEPRKQVSRSPSPPPSPGGGLDALLESLNAELGVEAEDRDEPATAVPAGSPSIGIGIGGVPSWSSSSPPPRYPSSPAALEGSDTFADMFRAVSEEQKVDLKKAATAWSADECALLKTTVKKVWKRLQNDKELLWQEVSREMGGSRTAKECKVQYSSDHRAKKAAEAAKKANDSLLGGTFGSLLLP